MPIVFVVFIILKKQEASMFDSDIIVLSFPDLIGVTNLPNSIFHIFDHHCNLPS